MMMDLPLIGMVENLQGESHSLYPGYKDKSDKESDKKRNRIKIHQNMAYLLYLVYIFYRFFLVYKNRKICFM